MWLGLKFRQRLMLWRYDGNTFFFWSLRRLLNQHFTFLDRNELRAGRVLRPLTIRIIVILILLCMFLFANMELHYHIQQVSQFLAFHPRLIQLILGLHWNLFESILTTADLEHTYQTDKRGPTDFDKFLLVRWGDELLNKLKRIVKVSSEAFGLSH